MALIKCLGCGAQISDKALACPKCGWANAPYEPQSKNIQQQQLSNQSNQTVSRFSDSFFHLTARVFYCIATLSAFTFIPASIYDPAIYYPTSTTEYDYNLATTHLIIALISTIIAVWLFRYSLRKGNKKSVDYFLLALSSSIIPLLLFY